MDYARSKITHSSTGAKTWTVGFAAKEFELVVAPAPGASSSTYRLSRGGVDTTAGVQDCDSVTIEATPRVFQQRFTDRTASVWQWSGTAWAEVFKITYTSVTATDINYTVDIGNSNFQVTRIARG